MTITDTKTFISRRIKDMLAEYAEDEHLEGALADIKYFNQHDPYMMLLWPDRGITKGVIISFGQSGDLYVEIYGAVDVGLQRKWIKTQFMIIPDVEKTQSDWLPYLKVTIKAAHSLISGWTEKDLTQVAPLLTDCGWIDIQVGSMPTLTSNRLAKSPYRMKPMTLILGLFFCFILALVGFMLQNKDLGMLLLFFSAVGEVCVIGYHIAGRKFLRLKGVI